MEELQMSAQMHVYSLTDLATDYKQVLEVRLAAFVDLLDEASVLARIAKANTPLTVHDDFRCANLEKTVNVVPFNFSHRRLHRSTRTDRGRYAPALKLCAGSPNLPAA
jgi:hypothetical protein